MAKSESKLPKRLYKYRAFNAYTLQLLTSESVFYADPTAFNDPLDCDPTIQIDTDRRSLEKLCYGMLVAAQGKESALAEMNNYVYLSTEYGDYKTDPEVQAYYMRMLASHVKDLLLREFSKQGVLSLGSRWDCPLMWSHYADQHRGICIEYSLVDNACKIIGPVNYRRSRSVKVSDLVKWKLEGLPEAARTVHDTFFFSKASQWRYEREWRVLYELTGEHPAPFRMAGVYFGLRCSSAVTTSVVKLFTSSARPIRLYDIYPKDDSFRLARRPVDTNEIEAVGVTTSALLDFKDAFIDTTST